MIYILCLFSAMKISVAKQLAQAPPTTPFLEKILVFSTILDPSPAKQRDRAASESSVSAGQWQHATYMQSQHSVPARMMAQGSRHYSRNNTPTSEKIN